MRRKILALITLLALAFVPACVPPGTAVKGSANSGPTATSPPKSTAGLTPGQYFPCGYAPDIASAVTTCKANPSNIRDEYLEYFEFKADGSGIHTIQMTPGKAAYTEEDFTWHAKGRSIKIKYADPSWPLVVVGGGSEKIESAQLTNVGDGIIVYYNEAYRLRK